MKKIKLLVIFALFSSLQLNAQQTVVSDAFKISFVAPELLEEYDTEDDSIIGFENDNYAVDIEVYPRTEEIDNIYTDLKYGARKLAEFMDFENIVDGGKIPNITKAYYVKTEEDDGGTLIPVYILLIINDTLDVAYEVSIYCYGNDAISGEQLVKSFKLLD